MTNSSSRSSLRTGIAIALVASLSGLLLGLLELHQIASAAVALSTIACAYSMLHAATRPADEASDVSAVGAEIATSQLSTCESAGDESGGPAEAGVWPEEAEAAARVLDKIAHVCGEVAKGNFEARIVGIAEGDRIASVQHAVNGMIDRCDAFVREASAAMEAVRHHKYYRRILREGLSGALDIAATTINKATEAMQRRAAAFDAASDDIRQGVNRSTEIARQAVTRADEANRTMKDLSAAADRIGSAVTLIGTIASQTNLLALNAAIEAAHAGEAGKGFAVVAQEVKNLSNQTAVATKDISEYMTQVLSTTRNAVDAIETIGNIINEIDQCTSMAMKAVISQVQASEEVAEAA